MVEWVTTYTITSADQTEMLAAMEWLRDNYASKIDNPQATGRNMEIQFSIKDLTFEDAVTTLTAMQTQFTTRLEDNWSLMMQ